MVKEITKARIIQEIQDRLKLREFEPQVFTFDEKVIPTYNIENHLSSWVIARKTLSITETGGVEVFRVPQTERWYLNGYTLIPAGAGAFTIAGGYISREKLADTYFVYLDLTAGQTAAYTVNLPKVATFDSSDRFMINIDGYTSTQDLYVHYDVRKEEVR